MSSRTEIRGECIPRFATVRDAFAANFAGGLELGVSFAATLDGELVVDLWGGAIEQQTYGKDLVLGIPIRWGLGLMLASQDLPVSPNPRTCGHGGWGGSLAFADLDARVSWAYVMNKMSPGTTGDARAAGLVAALYGSL